MSFLHASRSLSRPSSPAGSASSDDDISNQMATLAAAIQQDSEAGNTRGSTPARTLGRDLSVGSGGEFNQFVVVHSAPRWGVHLGAHELGVPGGFLQQGVFPLPPTFSWTQRAMGSSISPIHLRSSLLMTDGSSPSTLRGAHQHAASSFGHQSNGRQPSTDRSPMNLLREFFIRIETSDYADLRLVYDAAPTLRESHQPHPQYFLLDHLFRPHPTISFTIMATDVIHLMSLLRHSQNVHHVALRQERRTYMPRGNHDMIQIVAAGLAWAASGNSFGLFGSIYAEEWLVLMLHLLQEAGAHLGRFTQYVQLGVAAATRKRSTVMPGPWCGIVTHETD